MKRMLEIKEESIHVNFSSLDIIQSCLKKANYVLERGFQKSSNAASFGTAIHKAMEVYYTQVASPPSLRLIKAQKAFTEAWPPSGDPTDKRSNENGLRILEAYAHNYADDPWVVYSDHKGYFIEREFEFPFQKKNGITYFYHGTIDAIWQNVNTGELVVVDHKTTSSLGQDFMNRAMMSTQFMGYIRGAQMLGVPANGFLINGIGVFKGPKKFLRFEMKYDADQMLDFYEWAEYHTDRYIEAVKRNKFPISAPTPCSQWGGCQFIEVCSSPLNQRENILQGLYESNQNAEISNISDI